MFYAILSNNDTTFPNFFPILADFSLYTSIFARISESATSRINDSMNRGIFPLRGVVQHYAWGGYQYLPHLLSIDNTDQQPFAEYWLGTHPKGPATFLDEEESPNLGAFFAQSPEYLGEQVQADFGALPFLFKILDVRQMLSIQLHPTRPVAMAGFAREEAAGIPRLAPHRNYKDQNHKPEVMVALTDFWLLHGFRSADAIRQTLLTNPGWNVLLPVLEENGVKGLYEHVMRLSAQAVSELLEPLRQRLMKRVEEPEKGHPDHWATRAFEQYSNDGQHDRGIFSVYWFNLVQLAEGEGIFQGAGIPHAYLEGVNVELMANSDNVLRGGLTPKHIDVDELLANIIADPVVPQILKGLSDTKKIIEYPVPVADFSLRKISLQPGESLMSSQRGPAIYLLLEGAVALNDELYQQGQACLAVDGARLQWQALGDEKVTIYCAYV